MERFLQFLIALFVSVTLLLISLQINKVEKDLKHLENRVVILETRK